MKVAEFEELLNKLTVYDIEPMGSEFYREFDSGPLWTTGAKKAENIRNVTRWVKGDPARVAAVTDYANKKISEKALLPTRGPAPNTKYIKWSDFTSLSSYNQIAEAVEFRYDLMTGNVYNPVTKDGYLSVYAIYNMNAWANWKSSSLSEYERSKASAIDSLNLVSLMKLNDGRIKNQPALFPENMLT